MGCGQSKSVATDNTIAKSKSKKSKEVSSKGEGKEAFTNKASEETLPNVTKQEDIALPVQPQEEKEKKKEIEAVQPQEEQKLGQQEEKGKKEEPEVVAQQKQEASIAAPVLSPAPSPTADVADPTTHTAVEKEKTVVNPVLEISVADPTPAASEQKMAIPTTIADPAPAATEQEKIAVDPAPPATIHPTTTAGEQEKTTISVSEEEKTSVANQETVAEIPAAEGSKTN